MISDESSKTRKERKKGNSHARSCAPLASSHATSQMAICAFCAEKKTTSPGLSSRTSLSISFEFPSHFLLNLTLLFLFVQIMLVVFCLPLSSRLRFQYPLISLVLVLRATNSPTTHMFSHFISLVSFWPQIPLAHLLFFPPFFSGRWTQLVFC